MYLHFFETFILLRKIITRENKYELNVHRFVLNPSTKTIYFWFQTYKNKIKQRGNTHTQNRFVLIFGTLFIFYQSRSDSFVWSILAVCCCMHTIIKYTIKIYTIYHRESRLYDCLFFFVVHTYTVTRTCIIHIMCHRVKNI